MLSPPQLQESLTWSRSARCELLFDLTPFDGYQVNLINDPSSKVAANLARRSGKTTISGAHVALACIERPGIDAAVFAPTNSQAKEAFREVTKYLKAACRGVRGLSGEFNKTELTLSNGSRAYCMSLGGSETSRGRGPEVIWIDEGALIGESTINRVVRPMQLTHSDPSLWLTSTPRGKSGYFYDACRPESSWSVHHATAWDNPLVDPDELRAIRSETDSLTWETEYEAQFAEDGSSYLPADIVNPCISGGVDPEPAGRCWLCVDPARQGADHSAYLLIDETGCVRHAEAVERETVPETVDKIRALTGRFSPVYCTLIDESSGASDVAREELPNVRPMGFSLKRKARYYRTLRRMLEARDLALPDDDVFIDQLTDLEFDFTTSGQLRVHGRLRDDLADALAMGAYAVDRGVASATVTRDVRSPIQVNP